MHGLLKPPEMCGIWTVKTPPEKTVHGYLLHCYPTFYLPELSTKLTVKQCCAIIVEVSRSQSASGCIVLKLHF